MTEPTSFAKLAPLITWFIIIKQCLEDTAWKVSKYGVISGPYFPTFGLNTGKYGPEITLYLNIFHVMGGTNNGWVLLSMCNVEQWSMKKCIEISTWYHLICNKSNKNPLPQFFFEGNKYLKTIVPDFRGGLFTLEKEELIIFGKSGAFPLIIFFPFEMSYFYNLRTMMPIV